jgi:hypothetical protein
MARKRNTGLCQPQIRILRCLMRSRSPLTRKEISERANVDRAWLTYYLGAARGSIRAINDLAKFPGLLTLKYVKRHDVDGHTHKRRWDTVYEITQAGRKALGMTPPVR